MRQDARSWPCGLTLAQARAASLAPRQQLRDGVDPIDARQTAKVGGKTFKDVTELLTAECAGMAPILGDMRIAEIGTNDVLKALPALWATKLATAIRVRGRIEMTLSYAKVRGWHTGDNPATWKGHLDQILSPGERLTAVQHHPAPAWREVPEFMSKLRTETSTRARAL
jgi:hypothetical protein